MKKIVLILVMAVLVMSCSDSNPKYADNLATAKKFFALHGEENYEEQLKLISKDIQAEPPFYASGMSNYEEFTSMVKGYQEAFDNIKYNARNWLPGTDSLGVFDGSVRTYGNWTGVHTATGKQLDLKGYWYFNFDDEGKVIAQGDFFDFGGMMQAVGPKTPVLVTLKVKPGKKQAMIDLLNTPDGLQATREYDGNLSLEAFFNDDTYTYYIYGNWASYDHYQTYLDWRFSDDESKMAQQVMALCVGGERGLTPLFPNTDYASFNN